MENLFHQHIPHKGIAGDLFTFFGRRRKNLGYLGVTWNCQLNFIVSSLVAAKIV
jgi:hypothetical protein